jgi:hypothetical protein
MRHLRYRPAEGLERSLTVPTMSVRRISCDVVPWSDRFSTLIIEGGTKALRPILDTRGV